MLTLSRSRRADASAALLGVQCQTEGRLRADGASSLLYQRKPQRSQASLRTGETPPPRVCL